MFKSIAYYGFLCAVSLIFVSGLPTRRQHEDKKNPALLIGKFTSIYVFSLSTNKSSQKSKKMVWKILCSIVYYSQLLIESFLPSGDFIGGGGNIPITQFT